MRCEQCGNEFEAFPGEPCPRCGHSSPLPPTAPPPTGPAGPGAGPEPSVAAGKPPPPGGPRRDGPPWEQERSLRALGATLKGVLLEPTRTFREASQDAQIGWAVVYWTIFALIGALFNVLWQAVIGTAWLSVMDPYLDQFGEFPDYGFMDPTRGLLLNLVLMPVLLVMGLAAWFIWTGIVHLLLMLFNGAHQGYEASFRALTYASASAAIFQALPLCGGFIAGIWSLVVQILALMEIHETSGGKAAAAVLGPLAFCCACVLVAIFFFGAMIASLAGQG